MALCVLQWHLPFLLQEDVLFPVDPRLAALRPVGGELADLWVGQQLPDDDDDMAAELRKIGGCWGVTHVQCL